MQIQIGGSDQYGNIVAGMDAVKYCAQSEGDAQLEHRLSSDGKIKADHLPMGITTPLLTTARGEKKLGCIGVTVISKRLRRYRIALSSIALVGLCQCL